MSKKLHTELVYVWRLDGFPKIGSDRAEDCHYKVLIATSTPRITVESFRRLLESAFVDQGWASFAESSIFRKT